MYVSLYVCRATQCLHCSDAGLLLQPQRKCQHQAQECPVHGGWAREPCAAYVPYPVARPVQHEQEGYDANGHALASNFIRGNQTCLHLQEGQTRIFGEGFQQRREREKNVPVPILHPGLPRKSTLRSIATYARIMGVLIPRTTLVIVVGSRKTEQRSQISMPLRKAVRKQIPWTRTLRSLPRKLRSSRKRRRNQVRKRKSANTRIVIPTLNRELGRIALGK